MFLLNHGYENYVQQFNWSLRSRQRADILELSEKYLPFNDIIMINLFCALSEKNCLPVFCIQFSVQNTENFFYVAIRLKFFLFLFLQSDHNGEPLNSTWYELLHPVSVQFLNYVFYYISDFKKIFYQLVIFNI